MRQPTKIQVQKKLNNKGHLAVMLLVKQENGDEVSVPYDTRGQVEEPSSPIYVFNSQTGEYEKYTKLASARARIMEHYERTSTVQRTVSRSTVNPIVRQGDIDQSSAKTEVVVL